MNVDTHTIDRIVAGVLNQLASGQAGPQGDVAAEPQNRGGNAQSVTITANVVTADVLLAHVDGKAQIIVSERAIVTPAAWDAAKDRGVEIVRSSGISRTDALKAPMPDGHASRPTASPLLVVVRNTDGAQHIWDDLKSTWRRELLGCPDDAAALAASAICRGDAAMVVILAEQTHRAACLANRNDRVKAVAVRDAGDIRSIRQQLRANVWCLNPTGRSSFELRNVLRAITDH